MLELFRRNHFLNSLLLLPYSFLMGLDFFFIPSHVAYPENSPIYTYFFGSLEGQTTSNALVAIFLLFFQAVLINRILIRQRMGRQTSLLAGVIYILLMNVLPGVRGVHDVMIANLFAILMISNGYSVLRLYRTEKLIFNMGFWAAIAFIFFPAYIVLVPFMFVVMYVLRTINPREMTQAFVGYINVILLVLAFCYVGNFPEGYNSLDVIPHFRNIGALFAFGNIPFGLFLGFTYLLVILGVLRYYSLLAKQDFKSQKKIKLTYYLLAFLWLGIVFVHIISPHHLLIAAIPLSMILGILLTHWTQKLAAELIHLLVVIGILYLHFQTVI